MGGPHGELTEGAVATMIRGTASDYHPIVQIINVKSVGPNGERFRMILSDGEHYCNGMLATQQNNLVHSGQICENVLVKVLDYMNNQVQGRMVVIVLGLEVFSSAETSRIGNPQNIDQTNHATASNSTTAAAPAAQPMYNNTDRPTSAGTNPYGKSSSVKHEQQPSGTSNTTSNNPYGRTPSAPIIRSAPAATASGVPITPIAQLNMYQNRWTIKARVTSKSDIRSWSNARGDGTLFSIELLDASGMDVKATFFKEAVDKFYGILEADKVYTLSGGRLKVANLQYNTCKSNYEITFDQNAEIHLQDDDSAAGIAHQLYEFVKISELEQAEAGKVVDLLGVVQTVGEAATIVSKKSGQELIKCDLSVIDDSGVAISVTMWGEKAKAAPQLFADQPVVAFRRVRLSDYNGKSGSLTASGAAVVAPPLPETDVIQKWWTSGGGNTTQARSLSTMSGGGGGKMDTLANRQTIAAISEQHLGTNSEKADWISFKATLTFIKKDKEGGAWYTACANAGEPCKNRFKVTQTTDMAWFCDKCQGTYPNCVRRWIFSATIADDSATTWVSFFNEQAETLFQGATADTVYGETFDAETGGDQDKYDSYFARANHTDWIFKCRVKQEMMGEETRVKTSVYTMHPVNYAQESRDLLAEILAF